MKKASLLTVCALITVFVASEIAEARIVRVARQFNVFDVYGGFATPHGKYDKLGELKFTDENGFLVEIDADAFLEDTYFFGVDYGRLVGDQLLATIGYRFTNLDIRNDALFEVGNFTIAGSGIDYYQHDLGLDFNYLFMDISRQPFSPYVGLGLTGGWKSFSTGIAGADDDGFTIGVNANFGFEYKFAEMVDQGGFLTVSSINSYNLLASDDRPRYLNLGIGLRYYFRSF